jgi:hypothetical protein
VEVIGSNPIAPTILFVCFQPFAPVLRRVEGVVGPQSKASQRPTTTPPMKLFLVAQLIRGELEYGSEAVRAADIRGAI